MTPSAEPFSSMLASVVVDDLGERVGTQSRVLAQTASGVDRVPGEKLLRLRDGPAGPAMLVAEVRLVYRLARGVEIEVRRPARRSCRSRENDPRHVGNGLGQTPLRQLSVAQKLAEGDGREPVPQPA